MTTAREERLYWEEQALLRKRNELTSILATAGKWQTTMTGLLTGFTGVAFVWGPDKVKEFPVHGDARYWLLFMVLLGGAIALGAIGTLARAAHGPEPEQVPLLTGAGLAAWTHKHAVHAKEKLDTGRQLAVLAAAIILAATTWLLLAAAREPAKSDPSYLVDDGKTVRCGSLKTDKDGGVSLKVNNTTSSLPAGTTVTTLKSC